MKPYTFTALLPIKDNSERIPGKNFKEFLGRPLYQWILDTLLAMPQVNLVVINTDSSRLLENEALKSNQRILLRSRPSSIRGDFVSMNEVIKDDIKNVSSDFYLMTHTTNPLLSKSTITKAISVFQTAASNGSADSLFTVNRFQSRFYFENGLAVNHDPNVLLRTQDLPPLYEENSNLYIFSSASFRTTNARIGAKPILFETPRLESVDIDDTEGWTLAESIAKNC